VSAPTDERAVLQRLTELLAHRGVDAVYEERDDTDTTGKPVTYRWIGLNGHRRRYYDTGLWWYPAGWTFKGERLTQAQFIWGHNFEHRVAAEPIEAAAGVVAAQARARAEELRLQRGGGW